MKYKLSNNVMPELFDLRNIKYLHSQTGFAPGGVYTTNYGFGSWEI